MQKNALGIVGIVALVLASLSGGYIYAAQGGASAQDKKQLGLFNGNDEFIGTLIGMETDNATGGVEYQAYISGDDAVVRIKTEAVALNSFFGLSSNIVYFNSLNCSGNSYFFINDAGDNASFVPQMIFPSKDASRQFAIVSNSILDNILITSKLDNDGICNNFPAENLSGLFPTREVSNISLILIGKPRIKTL